MLSFHPECWSEHEELEVVMLCAPSKLDVPDIKIAENVQWDAPVHHVKAHENFLELKGIFENAGIQVIDYSEELPQDDQRVSEQLLNRFFVRDLACVFGNIIVPGEAGISIRRPEYVQSHQLMKKWFPEAFLIHQNNNIDSLEFGDVLILNKDAVLINIGLRTSVLSVERVKEHIFAAGFSEIGVIDLPRNKDTLHLDMNCNIANEDLIISKRYVRYFPVRILSKKNCRYEMSEQFFQRHGFEVYWIDEYDSIPDINFLNLDPETLLISKQAHKNIFKKHPKLQNKKIIEVEVTELEKAGGGIRCMTLPFRRRRK